MATSEMTVTVTIWSTIDHVSTVWSMWDNTTECLHCLEPVGQALFYCIITLRDLDSLSINRTQNSAPLEAATEQ